MDWQATLTAAGRDALEVFILAGAFFALALAVKGARAVTDGRAALAQTRVNLILYVVDALAVTPVVILIGTAATGLLRRYGLVLDSEPVWTLLGYGGTALVALLAGDFVGYWRHRLQHTPLLWPAHAVHHSDTHLTWFSLNRMHPIDRLGTVLDVVALGALGLPLWAVGLTVLARHYYGYFIHADLPWSYGKAGLILNTPVMHRWHHARDVAGSGANFATLFSIFDRLFGTYYAPRPCDVPLGVREDMGRGALGQYLHPFRVWIARAAQIRSRSQATSGASAGGIG